MKTSPIYMSDFSYVPILRDGRNEQQVVDDFDKFADNNGVNYQSQIFPLIELKNREDRGELDSYRDLTDRLMIEFPHHLLYSDNKYSDDVEELIDEYSGEVDLYADVLEGDEIPVVSSSAQRPMDYGDYLGRYRALKDEYNPVAIRLFIRGAKLDKRQKAVIKGLFSELRDTDIVLLDLVDVAGMDHRAYSNLEWARSQLSNQECFVLNAFKYTESNHNYGPIAAQDLNASGFGDYAINMRFPQEMNFAPPTKYIRLYDSETHDIHNYGGANYEEALDEVLDSGDWDPSDSPFVKKAFNNPNLDPSTWKRIRMGHYMWEVTTDTLSRMTTDTGSDLDEKGARDLP